MPTHRPRPPPAPRPSHRRWQELVEPLEAMDRADKTPTHLRMSEGEFRGALSLLEGALVGDEQPLAPLEDQEDQ